MSITYNTNVKENNRNNRNKNTYNRIKVLIIEDKDNYVNIAERILLIAGYSTECLTVKTIKDILFQVKTLSPDIILCDYYLNEICCLDAFEAVKATGIDIPFIVLSESIPESTAIDLMETGVRDYLTNENISRLIPIIKREMKYANERKEMRKIQAKLKNKNVNLEALLKEKTLQFEEINQQLIDEVEQRTKTLELLNDTQKFMDTILENLPLTIYAKDPYTHRFQFINQTGELLTGLKKEDILGKKVEDLIPKFAMEIFTNSDEKLVSGELEMDTLEVVATMEHNISKKMLSKKMVIKDKYNQPKHIIGIVEDLNKRERVENDLEKSEILLSLLFNQNPVAFCVFNEKTGIIENVNDSFLNLFEYKRYEVLNKSIENLTIWYNKQTKDSILCKLREKCSIKSQETSFLTRNGIKKVVLLSGDQFGFEDDKWIILSMLDISDKKEAEIEMHNALKIELDLSDMKSRLISMISHELRTPLTTIMLAADMLKRYGNVWDNENKNKQYIRIQQTVMEMTKMIENVLLMEKLDTGKFQYNPERIDLDSFCTALVESINFHIKEDSLVSYKYLKGCNNIMLDENLLRLILCNLLNNAIKFNTDGNSIHLNVFCYRNEAFFEVKDNGRGIPSDEVKNIFDTFYRCKNSIGTNGYGLGLTIVKKAVEAHQGCIYVDSIENLGTKFTVVLPITFEKIGDI